MALLAFEDLTKSPVGYLMQNNQRLKTASELNSALLSSQNQEKGRTLLCHLDLSDPKLPTLLKLLKYAQVKLDEKMKYPKINNIATAELENPTD